MKYHILISIIFISAVSGIAFSQEFDLADKYPYLKYNENVFKENINFRLFLYRPVTKNLELGFSFNYLDKIKRFEFQTPDENPFRRAEILFFGSLTFVTFGGWLFFSLYNVLIYNETFGKLRREQFLLLYLGSTVISISVSVSDLLISMRSKMKNVEVY
jgi:hypothetical protein